MYSLHLDNANTKVWCPFLPCQVTGRETCMYGFGPRPWKIVFAISGKILLMLTKETLTNIDWEISLAYIDNKIT